MDKLYDYHVLLALSCHGTAHANTVYALVQPARGKLGYNVSGTLNKLRRLGLVSYNRRMWSLTELGRLTVQDMTDHIALIRKRCFEPEEKNGR